MSSPDQRMINEVRNNLHQIFDKRIDKEIIDLVFQHSGFKGEFSIILSFCLFVVLLVRCLLGDMFQVGTKKVKFIDFHTIIRTANSCTA